MGCEYGLYEMLKQIITLNVVTAVFIVISAVTYTANSIFKFICKFIALKSENEALMKKLENKETE